VSAPQSRQHHYEARLIWTGVSKSPKFDYESYSREHRIDIPGKPSLRGTAAPAFRGDPALPNPEDLLVAALSACHFLSYIALCARAGVRVLSYEDDASGVTDRVEGVDRFTDVLLRPKVSIAAGSDAEKARALHERAHAICFIANSVNFPVRHEPEIRVAAPV
jgi:organic hydroperoxide reductase OsmC/OhrA